MFPHGEWPLLRSANLFTGGLHRSHSVGLTAFASGKSFLAFPKCLKSQTAQVSPFDAEKELFWDDFGVGAGVPTPG
jgi:hypothetical protein